MTTQTIKIVASKKEINSRTAICDKCDKKHTTLPVCTECLCVIPFKVGIQSSECPLKKW